jgi:hypothetical protein
MTGSKTWGRGRFTSNGVRYGGTRKREIVPFEKWLEKIYPKE